MAETTITARRRRIPVFVAALLATAVVASSLSAAPAFAADEVAPTVQGSTGLSVVAVNFAADGETGHIVRQHGFVDVIDEQVRGD